MHAGSLILDQRMSVQNETISYSTFKYKSHKAAAATSKTTYKEITEGK